HRTPMNLRVGFPTELTKHPADGAPAAPAEPPRVDGANPAHLAGEAGPNGPLHQAAARVASAQHPVFNIAQSITGLHELRNAVNDVLGGGTVRDADAGLVEGTEFYLS